MKNQWNSARNILEQEGVAVIPTDTLYGIVGKALSKKVVERIYEIRERDKHKPLIVLVSSYVQLGQFGIRLTREQQTFLDSVWPGKVSVILPVIHKKWTYLHRGTNTIAFRMVGQQNKNLFNLLKKVGPLVAPSANVQGMPPALLITEAKNYFGDKIDVYVNLGKKNSLPSTLVEYKDGVLKVLREGAVKIKK